jgi:hypothetical protein
MTTNITLCRTCSQPIEWRDTPEGRRPFDPGSDTRHADGNGRRQASVDPDRSHDIRRQVAAKCAATIVSAALQSRDEAKLDHFFPLADRILNWLEAS